MLARSKEWCDYYAADDSETRSEIFEEMLKDVSEPWAQTCRDIHKNLEEHTYTWVKCLPKKSLRMVKSGWVRKSCWLLRSTRKERANSKYDMVDYGLDELQHQCFSMDSDGHTFHHFNFTVKMKKSDGDWSSTPFFVEVKEIYGRKYYSCYELSSYDDGHCNACKNQGMHALKHPIYLMGYASGHADMEFSFIYLSDDE
ncbi:uncharacterized protein LOC125546667 [Triticum urartu]|uniref:uncharacterized protein LOC125546667 n=1 Tax=Triticum urartu TaxID=4572 RepID=UPI0020431B42|nr:uncharacterized protein LOC125546667 [Triticum urartu]